MAPYKAVTKVLLFGLATPTKSAEPLIVNPLPLIVIFLSATSIAVVNVTSFVNVIVSPSLALLIASTSLSPVETFTPTLISTVLLTITFSALFTSTKLNVIVYFPASGNVALIGVVIS